MLCKTNEMIHRVSEDKFKTMLNMKSSTNFIFKIVLNLSSNTLWIISFHWLCKESENELTAFTNMKRHNIYINVFKYDTLIWTDISTYILYI